MKKALSLLLMLSIIISSFSTTAYAAEATSSVENQQGNVIEITEEYIQKYGVHTVDEYGNNIIEVPLGPSVAGGIKYPDAPAVDDNNMGVHEGHSYPDGYVMPRHFSLTPHSHEIINLETIQYSSYIPVTEYALAGFTVTKSYDRAFDISVSLSLEGGITKNQVEGALGIEVGGTYSWGSGESYSAVVPSGYRGRIAYRYYSYLYLFDNKTTYIWSSLPLVTTEEIDPCSAESAPYDGYYYLQLLAMS